jgi:hypothetical protein
MKLTSFAVPALIVSLTAITVSGVGMLTVRASAISTKTSINLLRMQLRVTRLHEQLIQRDQERLAAQAEALRRQAAKPSEAGTVQPWGNRAGGQQP